MFRKALIGTAALSLVACTTAQQTLEKAGHRQLTGAEIKTLFTDVQENYVGKDKPGVTAVAKFSDDGSFSASWQRGSESGTLAGTWYVEDDLRCMNFVEIRGPNPQCIRIYDVGGSTYTSVWPDGKIHGEHRVAPL